MNSMFSKLPQPQQNNPLNALMGMLASGGNPQAMVNSLLQQNPQLNEALQAQKNSGMSMQDFTMQYAKKIGVDIFPLLRMVKK